MSADANDSDRSGGAHVGGIGIAHHTELTFGGIIPAMSFDAADLLKKALTLPAGERADLAGSLIESLDNASDESVKAAWDEEIIRRMDDLDSGRIKPVSLEEAKQRLSSAIE